jgi:glyoxylase-like metal-dependent hydrolase (beta-lactamase superfamily II)
MKLMEDVYLVGGGGFGYSHPNDCNVYLVDGGGAALLFDTGCGLGVKAILQNTAKSGVDPSRVAYTVVSHCHFDHIGGNFEIQKATRCKIASHESEKELIERLDPRMVLAEMAPSKLQAANVDMALKDGDLLSVGRYHLRVLHTPGHTFGSICLLFEIDGKKILLCGDSVMSQGRLGWINGPGFDLEAYKSSLARLVDMKVDVLLPGHGTFVLSGAHEHVKLYADKLNSPWVNIVTSIG